jgi:diguanylate cyclase (GGDEF)-like protein
LIVEDNQATRQSLQSLLELQGFQGIEAVGSGAEALAQLWPNPAAAARFDLILMDVEMPGPSGIDVCREIKGTPHLRDVPVLILTARDDEATLERAFVAGATDFLTKPVRPIELQVRVRSALSLKHELDRRKAREAELVQVTNQLKAANKELHRLTLLDELTGIPNRRYFNTLLYQEWERAVREALPLSLIVIDIDYFKNYNDHYGHPKGDACLTQVARALQALTKRPGDLVARYGGEEFVVLLAHTDLKGAKVVAEALRQAVERLALEHARSPVYGRVTISVGVAATVPERGSAPDRLLAAADEAVYLAKAGGRNRVKVYLGAEAGAVPGGKPVPRPGAVAGAR